jgi:hypothetical protein
LRIVLNTTNTRGWYAIFLEKGYDIYDHSGQFGSKLMYLPTNYADNKTVMPRYETFTLNKKQITYLNTNTSKCDESEDTLKSNSCTLRYIENQLSCKIPWLKVQGNSYEKCATESQFKKFEDLVVAISSSGVKQVQEITECFLPCIRTEYSHQEILSGNVKVETSQEIKKPKTCYPS